MPENKIENASPFATRRLRMKLIRVVCENTLVTAWQWSWRYMEWQKYSITHAVWDATRNPFKVWRETTK